jgi:hypothetical protein
LQRNEGQVGLSVVVRVGSVDEPLDVVELPATVTVPGSVGCAAVVAVVPGVVLVDSVVVSAVPGSAFGLQARVVKLRSRIEASRYICRKMRCAATGDDEGDEGSMRCIGGLVRSLYGVSCEVTGATDSDNGSW